MKTLIQKALRSLGYQLINLKALNKEVLPIVVKKLNVSNYSFDFWFANRCSYSWYDSPWDDYFEFTELNKLLSPGDSVLEIGCHQGFTSLFLSKIVQDSGKCVSLEAHPENAMIAMAQSHLNQQSNLQVLWFAGSNQKGSVRISNDTNSKILSEGEGIEVPTITADEIDEKYGPFNVLKLDVEGAERIVLEGSKKILSRKPKIALELHMPEFKNPEAEVLKIKELLDASEYEGRAYDRDGNEVEFNFSAFKPDMVYNLYLQPV